MFAVMTTEELNQHNSTLLIFSILFIFGTVTLGKMYLASGLLYAQILNMILRPGFAKRALFFFYNFYSPRKNSTLLPICSAPKEILVLLAFNSSREFTLPHDTYHFLYFILSFSFFAALHFRPFFERKTFNSFSCRIRCSYTCFLRCGEFVF